MKDNNENIEFNLEAISMQGFESVVVLYEKILEAIEIAIERIEKLESKPMIEAVLGDLIEMVRMQSYLEYLVDMKYKCEEYMFAFTEEDKKKKEKDESNGFRRILH